MKNILLIHFTFIIIFSQLELSILDPNNPNNQTIFLNGQLQTIFNDTVYNNKVCCKAGELYIYSIKANDAGIYPPITFYYSGINPVTQNDININIDALDSPLPFYLNSSDTQITVQTGCASKLELNQKNYFNKIDITITNFQFHFQINCALGQRFKGFQPGYIFIALFNAIVMIGVSLYSHIWSYQYNNLPIGITMNYKWFVPATLIIIILLAVITILDTSANIMNHIVSYSGSILAFIFMVICLNQIIYLYQKSRKHIIKYIRICDLISIGLSALVVILVSLKADDFVTNNCLALVIAVGSIKLLKFKNFKQAIICCSTVFLCQIISSVVIHYVSKSVSFNDSLGREIVSPLIIQFPALTQSLYRKCSWNTVSQIIFPGSTIAYLRRYDYSRSSKLYFVLGNTLFILSTIIWIFVQSSTIHNIPFASITYPALLIPILIIAYKRGQMMVILNGSFTDLQFFNKQQQRDLMNRSDERSSILIKSEIIDPLLFREKINEQ